MKKKEKTLSAKTMFLWVYDSAELIAEVQTIPQNTTINIKIKIKKSMAYFSD